MRTITFAHNNETEAMELKHQSIDTHYTKIGEGLELMDYPTLIDSDDDDCNNPFLSTTTPTTTNRTTRQQSPCSPSSLFWDKQREEEEIRFVLMEDQYHYQEQHRNQRHSSPSSFHIPKKRELSNAKRGRHIPGFVFIPVLILQWVLHPFQEYASATNTTRNHQNKNKHSHRCIGGNSETREENTNGDGSIVNNSFCCENYIS